MSTNAAAVEKKKSSGVPTAYGYGDKRSKEVKVLKSPMEGVDIMQLHDPKAIIVGLQQLDAYFTAKFGLQGDFLTTGELRESPEDGLDQINALQLSDEIKSTIRLKQINDFIKRCIEFDDNYVKIFGNLLLVLDKEGRDRVETHEDFADINKNKKNPLALWKLIVKVYNSGRGFATNNTIELKTRSKLNYDRCYQGEHMSLLDFKRILENHRQNLAVSNSTYQPTDQDFAADFLEKVNKQKYGAAVAHIKNASALDPNVFPKTIDAAYKMVESITARDVKYNKKDHSNIKNTAFVTANNKKKGTKSDSTGQNNKINNKDVNNLSIEEKKKTFPCKNCGELGHWKNECPNNIKANIATNTCFAITDTYHIAENNQSTINNNDMIWDSGATQHIYGQLDLCIDVRTVEELVQGFGSKSTINYKGDMPIFGECLIVPGQKFALISSSRVENLFRVKYNQLQSYQVILNDDRIIEFKYQPAIGLYICSHENFMKAINGISFANLTFNAINTVESNRLGYSTSELKRVDLVEELIRKFGYTSSGELLKVIKNGVIHDCPLTSTDVMNWNRINGNNVNHIKGSFTDAGAAGNIRMEPVLTMKTDQILNVDLFYFDNVIEFISVSEPMNMIMITQLHHRNMDEIKDAIRQHIAAYNARGFNVSEIIGDLEFLPLNNFAISGAIIRASGASNPIAERNGGVIKVRVRSVISSLPWIIPLILMHELIAYVVSMMNWIPRGGGVGEPARCIFEGRKLKMKEIELSFGEYCQVYDKNIVRKNDVNRPRTVGCIAIRSLFNGTGSFKFFNVSTRKFITSNNWIKLPAPIELCASINEMAADQIAIREFNNRVRRNRNNNNNNDNNRQAVNQLPADNVEIDPPELVNHSNEEDESIEEDTSRVVINISNESNDDANSTMNVDHEEVVNPNLYCFAQMSIEQAMKIDYKATIEGVLKEIKQIIDKGAIKFVKKMNMSTEELEKVIPAHMIMKDKYPDGKLVMKGRFVADGNHQIFDCDESYYSSTVRNTSIMIMLAEAASRRLYMKSIDIEGAYLEADMTSVVFVRVSRSISKIILELYPEFREYVDNNGYMYARLIKALYGTVQASSLWQSKWTSVLLNLGYEQCVEDDCIYMKEIEGTLIKIGTHVDDSIATHVKREVLDKELELIGKQFSGYKVSDCNKFTFLGMTIARNQNMDVIITMMDYTNKLCKQHNITTISEIPGSKDLFDADSSDLLNDVEKGKYHTAVYQCLYLAKKCVRCDILVYASYLSSKVNNPTEKNKLQLLKLLSYLYGTMDRGIIYRGGAPFIPVVYGDAAYMVHDDVRSRGGTIIMLCDGPIEAHSTKQSILTKSSTESELVNLDDTAMYTMDTRRLMTAMKETLEPTTVYQDNQPVISLIRAGKPKSMRTKHISMRYFTVCDYIKEGNIVVKWISTKQMLADILTKPLGGTVFKALRDIILPQVEAAYL